MISRIGPELQWAFGSSPISPIMAAGLAVAVGLGPRARSPSAVVPLSEDLRYWYGSEAGLYVRTIPGDHERHWLDRAPKFALAVVAASSPTRTSTRELVRARRADDQRNWARTVVGLRFQPNLADHGGWVGSANLSLVAGHDLIIFTNRASSYGARLTDHLTQAGIPVGSPFEQTRGDRMTGLIRAVEGAAALVVIMTPDAGSSPLVFQDLIFAQFANKPVFPLLLDGEPIAGYKDGYEDVRGGLLPSESFVARLREVVSADPPAAPEVRQPAPAVRAGTRPPEQSRPQPSAPARDAFICYRRLDSVGHAFSIFQQLRATFGKDRVFFDTSSIDLGQNYVDATLAAVRASRVVVVVVGPQWLTIADGEGRPRLSNSNDPVRLELQEALAPPRKHIVPVLVQGARMPNSGQLPPELKDFGPLNAFRLEDDRLEESLTTLAAKVKSLK
jgi:hypothetical protein